MNVERHVGLEALYWMRGPLSAPQAVAVVNMSRRSIDRLGLPSHTRDWPRHLHATLVERLVDAGAAAIVFDVFFKENRSGDVQFSSALRRSGRSVLFQRLERDKQLGGQGTAHDAVAELLTSPAAILADAAAGLAPFPLPKVPTRIDRFWAFKGGDGGAPTLPVVALQISAFRSLPVMLTLVGEAGPEAKEALARYRVSVRGPDELARLIGVLRRQFLRVRSERAGQSAEDGEQGFGAIERQLLAALRRVYVGPDSYFINFYGPPGTIRTIPYHVLLGADESRRRRAVAELGGKVVFIGMSEFTSSANKDGFPTVYSRDDGISLSGVEIAATAFANLLGGQTIRRLDRFWSPVSVLVLGVLLGVTAVAFSGYRAIIGGSVIAAMWCFGAQYAFAERNLWLPTMVPLIQLIMALIIGFSVQRLLADRHLSNVVIGARFFLPQRIVRHIASGGRPEPAVEPVYGICLFVDIEGYTTLSERLPSEDVARVTTDYYTLVDQCVEGPGRHGEIGRRVGDGVLAQWDARRFESLKEMRREACHAALEIRNAIKVRSRDLSNINLRVRIGLHEGKFTLGAEPWGDTANAASRIEDLNKHLGTQILVSERIAKGLEGVIVRRIGKFLLVGKSEAVGICELVEWSDKCSIEQAETCARFAEFLGLFEKARWHDAADRADSILAAHPGDAALRFLGDTARRYAVASPSGADAVIVMDRK